MVVSKVKLNSKTGNTLYKNVGKIIHLKETARTIFNSNDGTRYPELPGIYRDIKASEATVLNIGKLLRETSDAEDDPLPEGIKIKRLKWAYNQLLRGDLTGMPKKDLRHFKYLEGDDAGTTFTSADLTEAIKGGVTVFQFKPQHASKLGSAQFTHLKEAVKTRPDEDYSKIIKELETTPEPKDVPFDDSLEPVVLDRSVSNPSVPPAKKLKDKRRKQKASGGAAADTAEAVDSPKKPKDNLRKQKASGGAAADTAEAVDAEETDAPGILMNVVHHQGTSKPEKNPSLRNRNRLRDNVFAMLDEDAGIGSVEGETITLEDDVDTLQAEEDINERENPAPSPPPTTGETPDEPPDEPPVEPPVDVTPPPPPVNNRGTVPEAPNILDASRGDLMTPSALLAVSSQEEDKQRNKATILRLKEEIRALHLIYDNNITQFRENPHKAAKNDALKSKDIIVVRKHHKDMEGAVREYYRSGGGDSLQVGVIVPIDTYLSQYLNNVGNAERVERTTGTEGITSLPTVPRPGAASTAEGRRRTTVEGGASATEGTGSTTAGASHRNPDLKSTTHDPYSRSISQGIYYQRGGMGAYRQQPVSGHTIRIGGKRPVTFTPNDPTKPRVDAPMQNFLNRPLIQKFDSVFKIKT